MKAHFLLTPLLLGATALSAQQAIIDAPKTDRVKYQLLRPEEKVPESVKPNEPNPFNKADLKALTNTEASTEENKVKDAMLALRPTGLVKGPDGTIRSLMLGPLKLQPLADVPPVVPDQTAFLRVNSISETQVEMFWIEKKKIVGMPPRPLVMPISMTPKVRINLPNPSGDPTKVAAKNSGPIGYQVLPARQVHFNDPMNNMANSTKPAVKGPVPVSAPPPKPATLPMTDSSQMAAKALPVTQPPASAAPVATPHPANLLMKMIQGATPAQLPAQSAAQPRQ
jgi:hypothetical protein